jgi:hypothetical protein
MGQPAIRNILYLEEFFATLPKKEREKGNSSALRKLPGIGREAYWVGGGPLGALYVLSDTAYFRISIGGGEPEKNKIVKAKKLAQFAIKRF